VEGGVQEESAEKDVWAKEGGSNENDLHKVYPLSKITRDMKPRRKR
jgi:hypothetical protein